ncbi:MAG: tetratricopeptide repeat protein [Syntrophotaleaceae bacterium]
MIRTRNLLLALPLVLFACSPLDERGTIAQLRDKQIEIREEKVVGGLEKAMESYQHFLRETTDSPLAPEAIRRLADLKVEKEYGIITDGTGSGAALPSAMPAPDTSRPKEIAANKPAAAVPGGESDVDFERRASRAEVAAIVEGERPEPVAATDDLERAGALEAIELYQKLLREYPLYDRNDQVLYQMSRAYEELGRVDEAMEVMNRLVRDYPRSRYLDEVQFRRAEFFFTRRRYLEAEDAYTSIVETGVASSFYQFALYKLGWTFYKQELYEDGLDRFVALLDHQVAVGYDFEQTEDEPERKRMDDTFRVISLSFSYLGGADVVVDYFGTRGRRSFEDRIYSNLAEYYYDKRRYADATATYDAFVSRNPFHKMAPHFDMRVIEINMAGGFPSLVIDSKKTFATRYGLKADYWQHFDPSENPQVLGYLKTNLKDLANHYHALYQNPKQAEEKPANFTEALHWYREFLASFPKETESPDINYQLADLLLENRSFADAAMEYEKTAYDYPAHEKSSKAGYAAVFARREQLAALAEDRRDPVRRQVVTSSLRFAETFPEHEQAAIVLGAAADDLYALKDFEQAMVTADKLIQSFPQADPNVQRSAWLIVAHASYELSRYAEAENAYVKVLAMLAPEDELRASLTDNLAASIYKQGEAANAAEDYRLAADHFLRVGRMAPSSKIRPNAEYDAATALILLKDWSAAAVVLTGFRESFPEHELQPEVTKKIAFVYREDGRLAQAAEEYERIERESEDPEVRREALLVAADLYIEAERKDRALDVYRRYVADFPKPVELNLETRNKIAEFLKTDNRVAYLEQLKKIVSIEASAGGERTERTRYLAAKAALVLAEQNFDRFVNIRLVKPFQDNLRKKQDLMKVATRDFGKLLDYEIAEVTAASTFYMAEIYAHFSKALMISERPDLTFDSYTIQPGDNLTKIAKRTKCDISRIVNANDLNKSKILVAGKKLKIPRGLYPEELEQYELALEEQAYPFEEKAIKVHESNLQLLSQGIFNDWVNRSLEKLAVFVPARYARAEEASSAIPSPGHYTFAIVRPVSSPAEDPAEVENKVQTPDGEAATGEQSEPELPNAAAQQQG